MLRLPIVFIFGLWLRAESFTGLVVAIADGDTITVLNDGAPERIRLYGIDAPEKKQPFFRQAKDYVADLTYEKNVVVRMKGRDRWNRTIGEVVLPDRRLLNHEAVRAGYAWWFRKYAKGDVVLQSLEDQARTAMRGLWSGSEAPVPPWEWRAFYQAETRSQDFIVATHTRVMPIDIRERKTRHTVQAGPLPNTRAFASEVV